MKQLLALIVTLLITGCATQPYQPYARDVKKKPGVEGIIAIKREYKPEDRTLADSMMTQNCSGKPFTVVEEGEIQVGSATSVNGQARAEKENNGVNFGGFKYLTGGQTDVQNTNSTSETVALKEWHINYKCQTETKKKK